MTRVTFGLLACSFFFVVKFALCEEIRPKPINGVDKQCRDRGHHGACYDWLPQEDWIINPHRCVSLKCADYFKERPHIRPVASKKPLDGTICGDSKICRNGECVKVKPEEIPEHMGSKEKWICSDPLEPAVVLQEKN